MYTKRSPREDTLRISEKGAKPEVAPGKPRKTLEKKNPVEYISSRICWKKKPLRGKTGFLGKKKKSGSRTREEHVERGSLEEGEDVFQ